MPSTRFKPKEPYPLLRVVITGSRRWRSYRVMYARLEQLDPRHTRLYTGGARGADLMALRIAEKLSIPLTEVLADWQKLDRTGGSSSTSAAA